MVRNPGAANMSMVVKDGKELTHYQFSGAI
ncbi:DUF2149 domain-containing protein [Caulobacter hibisci]|nr:DUF2149 domain-containing protein [Caulobacter hibisci]